jgi:peptidylprolyl isomerase/FKBP-type peptidyl-prolyl cis-trans isomerase FklB
MTVPMLSRRLTLLTLAAAAALAACQGARPPSAADEAARAAEDAFMANNAKAPGVVSADGIEYKVLASGPANGPHPLPSDTITIDYEGRLLSGKVFDATPPGQPATFQLGELIPGWVAGLQLMRPGDEWILWIPPGLAYGDSDKGPIPGGSVLEFKIRLISIGAH